MRACFALADLHPPPPPAAEREVDAGLTVTPFLKLPIPQLCKVRCFVRFALCSVPHSEVANLSMCRALSRALLRPCFSNWVTLCRSPPTSRCRWHAPMLQSGVAWVLCKRVLQPTRLKPPHRRSDRASAPRLWHARQSMQQGAKPMPWARLLLPACCLLCTRQSRCSDDAARPLACPCYSLCCFAVASFLLVRSIRFCIITSSCSTSEVKVCYTVANYRQVSCVNRLRRLLRFPPMPLHAPASCRSFLLA